MVLKDLEEKLVSHEYARTVCKVAYDEVKAIIDEHATTKQRAAEREARKQRGIPYDEFVKNWVKDAPAQDLPYFGSWDDHSRLIASPPGGKRYEMPADNIQGVMMSNPKDRRINALLAEVAALKGQLAKAKA